MYIIGAITVGVFGFLYFGMLNTGSASVIFLAIVLSLIPHDMMYGPQAAFIAESFTPAALQRRVARISARLRHRRRPGAADRHLALRPYHSGYAIAVYIAVCAVVSVIASAMMPDYTGKDVSMEYDDKDARNVPVAA